MSLFQFISDCPFYAFVFFVWLTLAGQWVLNRVCETVEMFAPPETRPLTDITDDEDTGADAS